VPNTTTANATDSDSAIASQQKISVEMATIASGYERAGVEETQVRVDYQGVELWTPCFSERDVDPLALGRDEMAKAVAADIPPGSFVNLGIGQPTKVSDHLAPESGIVLHTENGMLGMGPEAVGDDVDPDLTNAGKVPVTELPGAASWTPSRSPSAVTSPTGTPGRPGRSRRSAAPWISPSARRTSS
jgi:Coenzyme A transferase